MTGIRDKTIEGLRAGDTFTVARTFSETAMAGFAELTRDYNPVHFDDRFAAAKGFKGRICHGLQVASLFTEIGGQIGMLAAQVDLAFRKPVFFGETVTCRWTFTEIDERGRARAELVFQNQDGVVVLTGTVQGIVPGEAERAVLKAMVEEGDPTNQASAPRYNPIKET